MGIALVCEEKDVTACGLLQQMTFTVNDTPGGGEGGLKFVGGERGWLL